MRIADLPTPEVLIDRPRVLANIARMQEAATARGLHLRPHAKTHKVPEIARWQIDRGAAGICCAKLGEAEVFAGAGIEDIRLPYPVHPVNADRVLALLGRVRLSLIVDHLGVARGWSDAMTLAGRHLDVLVKVDVGLHRCGIEPALPSAVAFLRQVASLPGLRLRGILSHAGHAYAAASERDVERIAEEEARTMNAIAAAARADGLPIDEISVGATPTARFSLDQPGLTELRPGNYVYFDRTQVTLGSARLEDCAMTVVATVVSKPAADRIILDCGSKTLTVDPGKPGLSGFGLVFEGDQAIRIDDSLAIERLSEEHAVVRVIGGATRLEPGDRVRVLPNHACVVSNMVDCIRLVEGDRVVETLPVAARGKIT
jgi:D-serine deaminase-like pyridoxal phosphate-dependent protein